MTVLSELQGLFEDVFLEVPQLTSQTTADDIEEWDSLSNVALIVAIEQFFGVEFATGEVEHFRNVGDLVASIELKSST